MPVETPKPENIEPKFVTVVDTVYKDVVLPIAIFFDINKHNLSLKDIASLKYLADYMRKHPESNFIVKGYSDSKTGTPAFNNRLSEKRASSVKSALVEHYGIPEEQITATGEGGVSDLFGKNQLNRATIIVPLRK